MKKTILTLGAAIILMGSYCTSNKTGETTSDTTTTKVDNVVTATPATNNPVTTDTQKVNIPKKAVEESMAAKPTQKLPPPIVAANKSTSAGTAAQIEAGGLLIKKSDCLACHNEVNKIVGPAYIDVAKKYAPTEANINYLIGKIIHGGAGVWGDIPMSPHPTLSKADAKLMVLHILSLKK